MAWVCVLYPQDNVLAYRLLTRLAPVDATEKSFNLRECQHETIVDTPQVSSRGLRSV